MPGSIDEMFAFLTQLMTQHASIFATRGQNMFRGFAVILICWSGIKTALSSAGGGPMNGVHFESLGSRLLTIAFGCGMVTYYSQPIPGVGISFYHLIVDQGLNLSNQLNHSLVQKLWDRLNTIYIGMEMPALSIVLNVMEVIRYSVVILCLIAAATAIFAVIAFGYVATAIAVLLGPIFIPFFIVPQMEWLFWGWLKAFIQYAFYPVVANAYLFVFGNLLFHFVDCHPAPSVGA